MKNPDSKSDKTPNKNKKLIILFCFGFFAFYSYKLFLQLEGARWVFYTFLPGDAFFESIIYGPLLGIVFVLIGKYWPMDY